MNLSTHIGSSVAVDDGVLFVAGWDHLTAFRLLDDDPIDAPDLQLGGGQWLRFGAAASDITMAVLNGGRGDLVIATTPVGDASLHASVEPTTIAPGGAGTLTVSYDGSAADLDSHLIIQSNDPDEPAVGFIVLANLSDRVDPGETAPDFSGQAVLADYSGGVPTITPAPMSLSGICSQYDKVYFAVFGSW